MLKKISSKILIVNSFLILILTTFFLIYFSNFIRNVHLEILEREMAEKINFIVRDIAVNNKIRRLDSKKSETRIQNLADLINLRITLVNMDGDVYADTSAEPDHMDNHLYRVEIMEAIDNGSGDSIRYSNTLRTHMLYYAEKHKDVIIRLAKPLYEIDASVAKTQRAILITGAILLAIATIINILISRFITRPISLAIDFADNFSNGDFSSRIHNYNEDEIGNLQRALNKLADNMQLEIQNMLIEQNKLKTVIENNQDAIAVINNEKRIVMANDAFKKLWGLGQPVEDRIYFSIIRNSSLNAKIDYILNNQSETFFEEDFNNASYEIYITSISEETGQVNSESQRGILVVLHDITERKRIETLKTELVGNLSHELKTPIAIVKGYLETIQENPGDANMCREFIQNALTNLERQNFIINDMLKLNMLETIPALMLENVDLHEIIINCTNILSPKASAKSIQIRTEFNITLPTVEATQFLCEEIFFNLLDNALNYNMENGEIVISSDETADSLNISISDTGVGIPPGSIGRIFERFYRVDKSRSRNSGGTGLGLSIVKHAAELLKWEVSVESEIGRGTTFTITIPHSTFATK
jgi:two-component system, OmpR family, phosphate regulon sensor histidine kinase PhoR